jgi:diketogulonate reductase-like aldo/keto reductase
MSSLPQPAQFEFCRNKGIWITACSPFMGPTSITPLYKGDRPKPVKDPKIKELADKYSKSAEQIILKEEVEGFYET